MPIALTVHQVIVPIESHNIPLLLILFQHIIDILSQVLILTTRHQFRNVYSYRTQKVLELPFQLLIRLLLQLLHLLLDQSPIIISSNRRGIFSSSRTLVIRVTFTLRTPIRRIRWLENSVVRSIGRVRRNDLLVPQLNTRQVLTGFRQPSHHLVNLLHKLNSHKFLRKRYVPAH